MCVYSNIDIRRAIMRSSADPYHISIEPFSLDSLQPASYDLHLGAMLIDGWGKTVDISDKLYTLMPGKTVLAHTLEAIRFGNGIVGRVEGISSLGRQFILVHCTAGWFDPGWPGADWEAQRKPGRQPGIGTLEIVNLGEQAISLEPGQRIAQFTFLRLNTPADPAYIGRYGNATTVEGPKAAKVVGRQDDGLETLL